MLNMQVNEAVNYDANIFKVSFICFVLYLCCKIIFFFKFCGKKTRFCANNLIPFLRLKRFSNRIF